MKTIVLLAILLLTSPVSAFDDNATSSCTQGMEGVVGCISDEQGCMACCGGEWVWVGFYEQVVKDLKSGVDFCEKEKP